MGAMLNHSCTPNAMQSFVRRRIVFRAMQPTAVGQEATISYVELAATRAERRAALLEGYAFDIDSGKVLDSSSPSASLSVSACASSSGTVLEQASTMAQEHFASPMLALPVLMSQLCVLGSSLCVLG